MPTSVRLSPDAERRLARLAERTGRSKAFYLRELIESQLDRLEWEYGILADLEDIRAGRAATMPLEQVERDLGLDG